MAAGCRYLSKAVRSGEFGLASRAIQCWRLSPQSAEACGRSLAMNAVRSLTHWIQGVSPAVEVIAIQMVKLLNDGVHCLDLIIAPSDPIACPATRRLDECRRFWKVLIVAR